MLDTPASAQRLTGAMGIAGSENAHHHPPVTIGQPGRSPQSAQTCQVGTRGVTNAVCQRLGGEADPGAPRDGSQPSPWAPCTLPLVFFPAGIPPPAQGSGRWGDRKSARAPTGMQGTEEIYTHILLGTFPTELGRNGHQIAFFIDLHYYGRWPLHFLPGGARIKGIKD